MYFLLSFLLFLFMIFKVSVDVHFVLRVAVVVSNFVWGHNAFPEFPCREKTVFWDLEGKNRILYEVLNHFN